MEYIIICNITSRKPINLGLQSVRFLLEDGICRLHNQSPIAATKNLQELTLLAATV